MGTGQRKYDCSCVSLGWEGVSLLVSLLVHRSPDGSRHGWMEPATHTLRVQTEPQRRAAKPRPLRFYLQ